MHEMQMKWMHVCMVLWMHACKECMHEYMHEWKPMGMEWNGMTCYERNAMRWDEIKWDEEMGCN